MKKNNNLTSFFIMVICFIIGILLGKIIIENWKGEVKNKVDEVLSKVIMVDVPPMDIEASMWLEDNEYREKYLTIIDLADSKFGIYEIKDNDVKAYAHGNCVSVGDVKPGTYEIVKTKSHYDYHDVRYWDVVELKEKHTDEIIYVSTPGYEIDERPISLVEKDDLHDIQIQDDVMLTVYDNGDPGTVLLVIDSANDKMINGGSDEHVE